MQQSSSNSASANANVCKQNVLNGNEEHPHPGLKLLSEHCEHDANARTIKYAAKYELTKNDKVFEQSHRKMIDVGVVMMPLCLLDCLRSMLAFGHQHGIKADGIGLIFCSPQIPFGGKICEPISKRNMDLDDLVERVLDKLGELEIDLQGKPFEVIANGVQQEQESSKAADVDSFVNKTGANENEGLQQQQDDSNNDEPGAKLLEEKFEKNLRKRTVKYTGKFKYVNTDKIFCKSIVGGCLNAQKFGQMGANLFPASFNKSVAKMMAHCREHGISPNCIGFTLHSPQLPCGVYTEPVKPNVNLNQLLGRVLNVVCAQPLALESDPYTMTIIGEQRGNLPKKQQEPGAQLLDEHYEQNEVEGTVKYTGKFMVEDNFDKLSAGYTGSKDKHVMLNIVVQMVPKCFHECLQKAANHAARYGIKLTQMGLIVRSEKIRVECDEIFVQMKPCVDMRVLVRGILDILEHLDVDLSGAPPFTVIVNGT